MNYNLTYMGALAAATGLTPDLAGVGAFIQTKVAPHIMTGGTDINQLFAAAGGTGSAHNLARAAANQGMLKPGTSAYESALNTVSSQNLPVVAGGSGIFDDSSTYNHELK